jgi:hypothetical protein
VLVIWALYAPVMIAVAVGVVMGVTAYTHHRLSLSVFLWTAGWALVMSAVLAVLVAQGVKYGRRLRSRSSV